MLRLKMIFFAYVFTVLYENMSGYMRGFGISLLPAAVTTVSICGSRLFWIFAVFPQYHDFYWIMMAYPVSLAVTAVCIFCTASCGTDRPTALVEPRKNWPIKINITPSYGVTTKPL